MRKKKKKKKLTKNEKRKKNSKRTKEDYCFHRSANETVCMWRNIRV